MRRTLFRAPYLLALLLFTSGCAGTVSRDLVTGKNRGFGYSWAEQVQIGQQNDPAIVAQFGLYDDPDLAAYVTQVGQEVLAESHARRADTPAEVLNTPFTFRVLDSDVINAFALPGGFNYVTRGLLAHVENEAQLAVVLGHEIGHVVRQHQSRAAFEQQRAQLGLIAGAVIGQGVLGGAAAENILGLGSQAAGLLFLKYGRGDERESDALGVEYASMAGYDASQGAAFFNVLDRLSVQSGTDQIPTWQLTHPDPGEREQTILELAAEWGPRTPGDVVNAERHLRMIDGIVYGENPRQGYVENSTFYHPDLRFQFGVPQGYQVQNSPTRVVMGQPNGQMIFLFTLAQQSSAQAAVQALGQTQGVRVVDSGRRTVNGLPASYAVADVQQEGGQELRLINFFVDYNGQVYDFAALMAAQQYSQFERLAVSVLSSFAPLNDQTYLNRQPLRIDVVDAPRTARFSELVGALPQGVTIEELAILNQVEANQTIPAGTPLKMVR
jgi:predicted Zn-dependent protease